MVCWRLRPVCLALLLPFALAAPAQAQSAATVSLCRSDKTDKGVAACTAILKGRGDRKAKASAYLSRAQIHWAQKRLAEAEKDYGETIKLAPEFAALYRDRGQIRHARGDNAGAMADFTTAIEKSPFDADNHANRGYLRMLTYDFAGAAEDIRKGIFWQKEHPRSHYMLGLLHYSAGRYPEAVAAIAQARSLGFKGVEAFITASRSQYYLGAMISAEKEASDGLALHPDAVNLIEIRARVRLRRGQFAEALADAEAAVAARPDDARALATRAAIRLASKDVAGARMDVDKALAGDPTLFDASEIKADILLAQGDKAGARAILAAASARTDAKLAYDVASRQRAAARVIELDKPPPIVVAELGEPELKKRCETRADPLRMQSCDHLVETAAAPEARAAMLVLRSRARPHDQVLGDLDLAVAAAPGYAPALTARAYHHLGHFNKPGDGAPTARAWADADSAMRLAAPGSPDWRNAVMARVAVSQRRGHFADAVTDLTRIVDADPATLDWIAAERAGASVMAGRPEEALPDLAIAQRALGATDDFSVDLLAQTHALALIDLGRLGEAQGVLASWEGRRTSPHSAAMREPLKARALLLAGADRAAFDLAAKMVLPGSADKAAVAVRGIAAARLGDALAAVSDLTGVIDEALPDPDRARSIGLTPGFAAELFLHRGLARAQLRQSIAARADFGEAIRRAPDRARPYAERARLALATGDASALADIAMALRIEPDEPRWADLAARINLATGDAAAAERYATAALAGPAPDPDLVLVRARARHALGRFEEAVQDVATRLATAPTDAEAMLIGIEARLGAGDPPRALAAAEAAHRSNGADLRILLALADLRARSGDAPGAIGLFETAAQRSEAAILANRRLGDLYVGIGSSQLALGYYARALEPPARGPADEAAKLAAREARDALIRKLSAPK